MLRIIKAKSVARVHTHTHTHTHTHSFIKESNNINKKKGNIILPRGYYDTG